MFYWCFLEKCCILLCFHAFSLKIHWILLVLHDFCCFCWYLSPNPWNPVKLHGFHAVSVKIQWFWLVLLDLCCFYWYLCAQIHGIQWNCMVFMRFHMKIPWIYMLCLWFSMDSNGTPSYWHWWFESMDCRSAATLNRSFASRFWCLWKSLGRVSMHVAHPCAHQPPRTMNFEFPAAIYSKILMKTMKSAEIQWPHSMLWAIQTKYVSLGESQTTK